MAKRKVKRNVGGKSLREYASDIYGYLQGAYNFAKKHRPVHTILEKIPVARAAPYGIGAALSSLESFGFGKKRVGRPRRKKA